MFQILRRKGNEFIVKCFKLAFLFATKLPCKKRSIVFESYSGKQYSCNPRAIFEYMRTYYPNYKMYWSANKNYIKVFEKNEVPFIKRFSIKWLFAMARAEYWVINSRLPLWISKPRHTTYLQTWHGTPLKKLAQDIKEVHMPGTTTEKYKENFDKAVKKWDYLVSPNAYSTKIFKQAFKFNKTIIESGYPRNDYLYENNKSGAILKIKQKCGVPNDKNILFYAPTWRDDQFYDKGRYKFSLHLDIDKLQRELGDSYIIILRMHYLVAENLDLKRYKGFVYDFSNYEDIRDLYLISDVLITDYSSVFFDFANLKRPMLFFTYDIESYRDNLRGFYFDFEKKAPGPLVKTTEEIINIVKDLERKNYTITEEQQNFYDYFCYLEDGNASKRVIERVFKG